jgi:membrane-associated protease RseP (regulator of RpoE activity)
VAPLNPYLGYEIALVMVVAYAVVVYGLWRAGLIGVDRTFSLLGPALMIKTRRGRSALDRWGRFVRFWTFASDVGILLAAAAMTLIVVLLLLGAVASFRLTPAQAPSPSTALALPGLNPLIPLGYGLVALVIGIVLHELCHGVVARSQKIGVKSLGILWCVIPVGAFVEQDDVEMLAASRRRRDRVAAAGVLANFALALLFFAALSAVVATSVHPNASGVGIAYVESNTPAANASLQSGDIILSVNGTATTSASLFESALEDTTPNETVTVVYRAVNGSTLSRPIMLTKSPTVAGRGFLGVAVDPLTPAEIQQTLVSPLTSPLGPLDGTVYWLVLPLAGLEPVGGSAVDFFHVSGPLADLGTGNFWIVANLLYWIAWMNLLLGLSNALPLVPLDGGLLFRDFVMSIAARFRRGWDSKRLESVGAQAAAISSAAVLVLLVWQFVVPRLI